MHQHYSKEFSLSFQTSKEKIAEALALKEKEKEKLEEEKISKVPEVVPVTPPPVEEPVVSEEQPATGVKGLTAKLQSKLADFKAKVDEYDKEATKKRVLKIWKMIRELGEENQREHKKFFEEYKEFLKEGEKVPVMKSEAAPAKGAKVATPVSEEEKKVGNFFVLVTCHEMFTLSSLSFSICLSVRVVYLSFPLN